MTDNVIGFDTGDTGGTSYSFQLQPIYAIDLPDRGFIVIPRGVIPIVGVEPGTRRPPANEDGNPTPSGGDNVWGLANSNLQVFFAPDVEARGMIT